jgi:hypothetical protein
VRARARLVRLIHFFTTFFYILRIMRNIVLLRPVPEKNRKGPQKGIYFRTTNLYVTGHLYETIEKHVKSSRQELNSICDAGTNKERPNSTQFLIVTLLSL